MKVMKLALLGTAALAAVSVSARADDLSALKAQIEALQADVAALQAAPSVPAGYSLVTMSQADAIVAPGLVRDKEYGAMKTATTFGIMPTADVPASTVIQWSGFVRGGYVHSIDKHSWDLTDAVGAPDAVPVLGVPSGSEKTTENHLRGRVQLDVTGTTDTAVGEVGAHVAIRALPDGEDGGDYFNPVAWGWWKMTPELTFGFGYEGSLATINHGADNMNAYLSDGLAAGPYGFGDTTQFRVSYASGPISAAVALRHDADSENHINNFATGAVVADTDNEFGFDGEVKYSGDMFSAEVAGGMIEDEWKIGAGATVSLSDMFSIEVGGQIGNSQDVDYSSNGLGGITNSASLVLLTTDADADYWNISTKVVANLSDSISAEVGASYQNLDWDSQVLNAVDTVVPATASGTAKTYGIAAGLYYTPVSQLTLGVEGSYNKTKSDVDVTSAGLGNGYNEKQTDTATTMAFVSIFRF